MERNSLFPDGQKVSKDALDRFYAGKAAAYFGEVGADVNFNSRKENFNIIRKRWRND